MSYFFVHKDVLKNICNQCIDFYEKLNEDRRKDYVEKYQQEINKKWYRKIFRIKKLDFEETVRLIESQMTHGCLSARFLHLGYFEIGINVVELAESFLNSVQYSYLEYILISLDDLKKLAPQAGENDARD